MGVGVCRLGPGGSGEQRGFFTLRVSPPDHPKTVARRVALRHVKQHSAQQRSASDFVNCSREEEEEAEGEEEEEEKDKGEGEYDLDAGRGKKYRRRKRRRRRLRRRRRQHRAIEALPVFRSGCLLEASRGSIGAIFEAWAASGGALGPLLGPPRGLLDPS
eukprot:9475566-Pyramimonas_sp.AAC.1